MATKFLSTLAFVSLIATQIPKKTSLKMSSKYCLFQEDRSSNIFTQSRLNIELSSVKNQVCFNKSMWNYIVTVSNKSLIPRLIDKNMPIGENQFSGNEERVWLRIMKGDSVFINSALPGRDALPNKKVVTKASDFSIEKKVNFRSLVYENSGVIHDVKNYTNKEYGEYLIQAIYFKGRDSVCSAQIKIHYLETCSK